MQTTIRQALVDMESAMRVLNEAGEGVPYRPSGFTNVRKQLSRAVADFSVDMENAGSLFDEDE